MDVVLKIVVCVVILWVWDRAWMGLLTGIYEAYRR